MREDMKEDMNEDKSFRKCMKNSWIMSLLYMR